MTSSSVINEDSFSIRKRELQREIYEALQSQDQEIISYLKSKLVHRFGLDSLAEDQKLETLLVKEKVFNESQQENDTKVDKPSEEVNQKNLFPVIEEEVIEEEVIEEEVIEEEVIEEEVIEEEVIEEDMTIELNSYDIDQELLDHGEYDKETEEYSSQKQNLINEQTNLVNTENQKKYIKKDIIKKNQEDVVEVTPPPPPSINNLRRWLN